MWESIIIALLPLISKLGIWYIENFISGADAKKKNKEAFDKWVVSHQKDSNTSATEHQSYKDQLNDLEKPKDESHPDA